MHKLVVESRYFAGCSNKSSEAAVLACTRVAGCFRVVVERVALSLLIVAFLSIVLTPSTLQAATIVATSCNNTFAQPHVSTAVASAANGDAVIIPAGNCTWTRGLQGLNCNFGVRVGGTQDDSLCISNASNSRAKYLTIQGAGIGQTIITDAITRDTGNANPITRPNSAVNWPLNPAGLTRVTGIEWRGTSGTNYLTTPGVCQGKGDIPPLQFGGDSSQFRFDNNKVVLHGGCSGLYFLGNIRGVVDHNFIDASGSDAGASHCILVLHDSWKNVGTQGDNSWAQPDTLGTAEALFFEDNIYYNDQSTNWFHVCHEGNSGGRVVVRHNSFRASLYAHHGTGSALRSMRQYEIYENTFAGPDGVSPWDLRGNGGLPPIGSRGGVGVIFNNRISVTNGGGAIFTTSHNVVNERTPGAPNSGAAFGACSGTNVWDQNTSAGTTLGRLCIDQTGAGAGDYIESQNNGTNTCPGPYPKNVTRGCIAAWPRQAPDPTYGWNNTVNDVVRGVLIASSNGGTTPVPITYGIDVIDGQRPGYTPYTYPHPLTTGATTSGPAPAPPTGLRVQ
jgi:hypothetical protein